VQAHTHRTDVEGIAVDDTGLAETAQPEKPAHGMVAVRDPDGSLPPANSAHHSNLGAQHGYDAGYPREEPGAGNPLARICEGESRMAELLNRGRARQRFAH
jgi:hypothetical protein